MNFDFKLFFSTLKKGAEEIGLTLTEEQLIQMGNFASHILKVNQSLNLTRIIAPEEMAIKNFVDSLSLHHLPWPEEISCLDVGTGAGFPGVPLAILKNGWSVSLLDSLRKRLDFLQQTCADLKLTNVQIMHIRAEDAGRGKGHRESYDLVVSRAVASLPVLLELCIPLVKEGGRFVAFKGDEALAELDESQKALMELKVELEQVFPFELPLQMGKRHLLVFSKKESTPKRYPRRAGIPGKRPLK